MRKTKRVKGQGPRAKGVVEKKVRAPKEIKNISSIPVYDSKGKEAGRFELDKELFDGKVNKGILYQALLMYNANKRRGTASTKTRGEVSGGGKKPWRQKGTGRARAGSSRSPLWKGGGKVFGPHPRDFHYTLPKKITQGALLSSLNSKLGEERLIGISSIELAGPKTKLFNAIVEALKLKGKSLFVVNDIDDKLERAARNLEDVAVKNLRDFNAADVLNCEMVVIAMAALERLPERFKQLA